MRIVASGVLGLSLLVGGMMAVGCGGSSDTSSDGSEELTSISGSQRSLNFQGLFYVPDGTSAATIATLAQAQAKGAFGALRTANMAASSTYMTGIVPGSITQLPVNVMDTANPGSANSSAIRVTYLYKDEAIVPKTNESSTFSTALLEPSYASNPTLIRKDCTPGETEEAGEPIWYSLDTTGAACQADISAEASAIESDRVHLPAPAGFKYPWITKSELNRTFFPTVFALGSDTTNTNVSYPEYDKLYGGAQGVEAGKLVIGIIEGYVTHKAIPAEAALQGKYADASGNLSNDGYVFQNFMRAILAAISTHSAFAPTSPVTLAYTVNGQAHSFASFAKLAAFAADPGAADADTNALMQQIMTTASKTWLTFEAPVTVTTKGVSHPLTLKLQAYFGTDEENVSVFKTAFKHNDILGYMGHSYTGHGPYAPGNIVASDFASGYQLMFFNGCVSYNYYDDAFFALKSGGTRNLDLITNSIEGEFSSQEGTFAAAIFDGSLPSYTQILTRLEDSSEDFGSGNDRAYDPFRVVDGELDNVYQPKATPISIH